MKKVYKKILVIAAILITGGSIAFGSITISQNLELKKEITAVTQEKEKAEGFSCSRGEHSPRVSGLS